MGGAENVAALFQSIDDRADPILCWRIARSTSFDIPLWYPDFYRIQTESPCIQRQPTSIISILREIAAVIFTIEINDNERDEIKEAPEAIDSLEIAPSR